MAARREGLDGACWPTPLQEVVLRAAALPVDEAAREWRASRSKIDIKALHDGELYRLLPAVYSNLAATGTDDPELPLLKGLYRRTFYENQMLLHRTRPALALLHERGIPTVGLKGLPVAILYQQDLGARPMGDLDVVVPLADARAAVGILTDHGWSTTDPVVPERLFRWRPGINFEDGTGGGLDVHWRLRRSAPLPGTEAIDELAGLDRVPLPLPQGPTIETLGPTDLLLYAIEHGARVGSDATVRWAADAARILRVAGSDIDWDRFVAVASEHHTVLQVRNALTFLAEALEVEIPTTVLMAMRSAPVTRRDRRVFAVLSGTKPTSSPRHLWTSTAADWPATRAALAFPGFLRDSWGLRSVASVPFDAVRRATRKRRDRKVSPAAGPGPS